MFKPMNQPITCADGFIMSVQANEGAYCYPRNDVGPYTSVEVGFPSAYDFFLQRYAEDPSRPTETVYPNVPVSAIRLCIDAHGGWVSGELPPFDTSASWIDWPARVPAPDRVAKE